MSKKWARGTFKGDMGQKPWFHSLQGHFGPFHRDALRRVLSSSPELGSFVFSHALFDNNSWIDVVNKTHSPFLIIPAR